MAFGDVETGKNFQLDTGAEIFGTVSDSGGILIDGVAQSIWVYALSGPNALSDPACSAASVIVRGAALDADGEFSIKGLPGGIYFLRAVDLPTLDNPAVVYASEWWNGLVPDPSNSDCGLAASIEVALGAVSPDKHFKLNPASSISISGTVVDGAGAPIDGIQNNILVNAFSGAPCGTRIYQGLAFVDALGQYTIPGLPGVPVYVYANGLDAYQSEWWSGYGWDPSDPSSFDCGLAEVVDLTFTDKDFKMNSPVAGNINGSKAIDLADAILLLQIMSGEASPTEIYIDADVDGDGTFDSSDLIYIIQLVGGLR